MRRNKQRFERTRTAGVTWFEVVASILILLLLLTLASMYTVKNAIPASRRAECRNHLKQIATATYNRAQRHKNQLPHLVSKSGENQSNWVIELLPYLDRATVYRSWHTSDSVKRSDLRSTVLKVLQCPKDGNRYRQGGELSYVANSGYGHFSVNSDSLAVTPSGEHSPVTIDWNNDGEIARSEELAGLATGVFWEEGTTDGHISSLDSITSGDGQSNTFLFAENLHAGQWSSFDLMDLAFVSGLERIEFADPASEWQMLALKSANLGPFGPDGGQVPRRSPGPSSNHEGIVHFGMADGGARQVSSQIDHLVYLKLMTPNGQQFGQTVEGLENY